MIAAPIGAASFNNEFGRPNTCGYFRVFEQATAPDAAVRAAIRGYHKPIMVAGGIGSVRRQNVEKKEVVVGAPLVVLGGPSMLIGLGGGAASSVGSGQSSSELDFASVQRGNAEIQRRAQEVIDRCVALGDSNPILLIHDVGAGGLSNAHTRGHRAQSSRRPNRPAQNSQRRIGTLADGDLVQRGAGALRARARAGNRRAIQGDVRTRALPVRGRGRDHRAMACSRSPIQYCTHVPVDIPIDVLLGKAPRMTRDVHSLVEGRSSLALHRRRCA